ncbi:MAG: outer membrane beta-barrel protein [Hyphomicrobium sp.]
MTRPKDRRARAIVAAAAVLMIPLTATRASAGEWTGVYIGGGIGADAVSTDLSLHGQNPNDNLSLDGFGGGDFGSTLKAGADWQIADWLVIGAFVDYDWSTIETSANFSATDFFDTTSGNLKLLDLQRSWAVGGRIGIVVSPATLAYGLAGYTRAKLSDPSFSLKEESFDPFTGQLSSDAQSNSLHLPEFEGITFGGGFEHKITRNVSLWAEYRQSRFKAAHFAFNEETTFTLDPTLHIGRVGVAYRFGGAAELGPDESAAATRNWTGTYVGAGAGVDGIAGSAAVASSIYTGDVFIDANAKGVGGGDSGGTLLAGYDLQVAPKFVAGVSVSYDRSAHDFTLSTAAGGEAMRLDIPSLGNVWTFAARAGYLVSPDVMAYTLAGYTRVAFSDWTVAYGVLSETVESPVYSGFTVGLGFEKLIGEHFSLRAEYRYSALKEREVASSVAGPGGETLVGMSIDPSVHAVRMLGVYRFTGP